MGNMLMVFLSPLTTVCIFQNQDSHQHNCHTINQTWNSFIFSNYLSKEPFHLWSKMPPRIMLCILFWCLIQSRRVIQPFPAVFILNVFKEYRSFILGMLLNLGVWSLLGFRQESRILDRDTREMMYPSQGIRRLVRMFPNKEVR